MTETYDILANFSMAFYSRFAGSDFSNDINGRLFEDDAPQGTDFPYATYQIITSVPEKTFTEEFKDMLLQLDIFSSASSSAEIKNAYAHAHKLFDECILTMTGGYLLRMHEVNLATSKEDITTPEGTVSVRHYSIDFEILIEVSNA
jgi:hypothetical protein